LKYLVLLFLFLSLSADSNYSLRLAHGKVTDSDFGEVIFLDLQSYKHDLEVTSLDVGYLLKKDAFGLPLDIYAKGGLSYFDEARLQDDIYEGTIYIKVYWNIDFFKNRVRLGFGEGASYTSNILYYEKQEALQNLDNNSKYLNYIDLSLDFDIGRLVRYEPLKDTYLGVALKHRSGIFGLINNVEEGGSNYCVFSLEKNF
jgi:outer membrane protein